MPKLLPLCTASCVVLFVMTPFIRADNYLLTQYKEQWLPVVQVRGSTPYVLVDKSLKSVDGDRYMLVPTKHSSKEEPPPAWIDVRNFKIESSTVTYVGDSAQLNSELCVEAVLESAVDRKDVFVVIEIQSENGINGYLVDAVNPLSAGSPETYQRVLRLGRSTGRYRYLFHVFSGGRELLHTKLPAAQLDKAFNERIQVQMQGVKNAAPRPYFVLKPVVPYKLGKLVNQPVTVMVQVRVLPTGALTEPEIKECKVPALGGAALECIRQWRFVPKIVDGRAVESKVLIPVCFNPPKDT